MRSKILIVDDSRTMRDIVREALEAGQHEVLEAADGQAALAVLSSVAARKDRTVDLVITDVIMPEMDGLSLVRALREDASHRSLPILILSTEGSDEMKQRGREAGATGWLVKPFHPQRLREVVGRVLGSK
jgi:two-component system chemotaxis response regulator CheY